MKRSVVVYLWIEQIFQNSPFLIKILTKNHTQYLLLILLLQKSTCLKITGTDRTPRSVPFFTFKSL